MYKKFLVAALTITMVLGLAGCGGSEGSTQTASSQEKESSAAPASLTGESTTAQTEGADAPAVIKVGFLTPLSDNNAACGARCKAVGQMIADVVNEKHPGIAMTLVRIAGIPALNGAKIEFVFVDSKGDPTTATSEAKHLITEEGIVALTGQYTSAITEAVAVVTETYGIPLLTTDSSPSLTIPETGLEWYFRFSPDDTYYTRNFFGFIRQPNEEQDTDLMTVALVSEDTEFGASIRIEEERVAKEYGIEVVGNITYSSSATNVSPEVTKIKAASPDIIMMSSYASDAILYLKTFKEQDYVSKMLLGQRGGFVQTDFLDAMGKSTGFVCTTGEWSANIDTDTSKRLIELYRQYTPDGMGLNEDHCKSMINVLLIALGINQAGTTEPKALNEALRNLKVDTSTLPTLWGAITMDECGQDTSASAFVLQIRDEEYQTMCPSGYAIAEPVLPMPVWNER